MCSVVANTKLAKVTSAFGSDSDGCMKWALTFPKLPSSKDNDTARARTTHWDYGVDICDVLVKHPDQTISVWSHMEQMKKEVVATVPDVFFVSSINGYGGSPLNGGAHG